ncbi:hypothetical protein T492DRAFT_53982 [Pavlovales sp. CCMP2436]|nr:hypothetical protein T492DRAFT_53982 [Pavlovales sp. CCMP2436]
MSRGLRLVAVARADIFAVVADLSHAETQLADKTPRTAKPERGPYYISRTHAASTSRSFRATLAAQAGRAQRRRQPGERACCAVASTRGTVARTRLRSMLRSPDTGKSQKTPTRRLHSTHGLRNMV